MKSNDVETCLRFMLRDGARVSATEKDGFVVANVQLDAYATHHCFKISTTALDRCTQSELEAELDAQLVALGID